MKLLGQRDSFTEVCPSVTQAVEFAFERLAALDLKKAATVVDSNVLLLVKSFDRNVPGWRNRQTQRT
ncbi:MAG: hypothetical protein JWO48_3091 [Bryobacterales bacterium]|nr:hypothetical protein [Bryobacterales bacterium]